MDRRSGNVTDAGLNSPCGAKMPRNTLRYGAGGGVRFRRFTNAEESFTGKRQFQRQRYFPLMTVQDAWSPTDVFKANGDDLTGAQSPG